MPIKGTGVDVILAPQVQPAGRMTPVKMAMLYIISTAHSSLQPQNTHVRGDWKIMTKYVEDNYPIVTLRVGNEDVTERVYGRQLSTTMRGHYVTYAFSAHVWGEKSYQMFDEDMDDTMSQAQPASDLADNIIDTLEKYVGDTTSGICHFHKITARESEPERGPQRLTRIIIEGFVLVRRPLT